MTDALFLDGKTFRTNPNNEQSLSQKIPGIIRFRQQGNRIWGWTEQGSLGFGCFAGVLTHDTDWTLSVNGCFSGNQVGTTTIKSPQDLVPDRSLVLQLVFRKDDSGLISLSVSISEAQNQSEFLEVGYAGNPHADHLNPGTSNPIIGERLERFGSRLLETRRQLLASIAARRTRHFSLVLEDLKDPHNISAVIRTCEVFGLQDVHVIQEVNPYRVNAAILKGSYKWLDIFLHRRRNSAFESLKAKGYRIAVASTNTSVPLDALDLSQPTAFYLGSESMGNHPDTLARADLRFRIPQHGLTESMNVSVCAGVLMATLDRFLREQGRDRFVLPPEEQMSLLADFYQRSAEGLEGNSPIHLVD